jgi:hypothetical protein
MKKLILVFLIFLFGLSACSPVASISPTASPVPFVVASQTLEPILTQTPSPTTIPTETEIPLTPTLDAASLATFTPAAYAVCPEVDDALRLQIGYILNNPAATSEEITGAILDFLNSGGTLKAAYDGLTKDPGSVKVFTVDITNDRVPELVLEKPPYLFVFGCEMGNYNLIFVKGEEISEVVLYSLKDLNMNGIPELIYRADDRMLGLFMDPRYSFYFFEWNGQEFQNILANDKIFEGGLEMGDPHPEHGLGISLFGIDVTTDEENKNKWVIGDFDNNGISDIRIIAGIPVPMSGQAEFPERQTILTLSWNGKQYVPANLMSKAVFRVDVARDADAAFLNGDYENALSLYQVVLQNDSLLEWEHPLDRSEGIIDRFAARNRMSAYAYYRIMLTYVVLANSDDALRAYETLQGKYAKDEVTRPYADMGAEFWVEYQASNDVKSACAKVILYAESQQAVFAPFRDTYDIDYGPGALCPLQ